MRDFNAPGKATLSALPAAAKRRAAASSVASVASGYERSLRPCLACFSLAGRAVA
jgi:hypothetical protein